MCILLCGPGGLEDGGQGRGHHLVSGFCAPARPSGGVIALPPTPSPAAVCLPTVPHLEAELRG